MSPHSFKLLPRLSDRHSKWLLALLLAIPKPPTECVAMPLRTTGLKEKLGANV